MRLAGLRRFEPTGNGGPLPGEPHVEFGRGMPGPTRLSSVEQPEQVKGAFSTNPRQSSSEPRARPRPRSRRGAGMAPTCPSPALSRVICITASRNGALAQRLRESEGSWMREQPRGFRAGPERDDQQPGGLGKSGWWRYRLLHECAAHGSFPRCVCCLAAQSSAHRSDTPKWLRSM